MKQPCHDCLAGKGLAAEARDLERNSHGREGLFNVLLIEVSVFQDVCLGF